MSCAGVGHNCLRKCRDRAIQCVICISAYKAKNHRCKVVRCTIKIGKICAHVTLKYANCEENHQAIAFKCLARLKA